MSLANGWWTDNNDPLDIAAKTFSATTGTGLSAILATEVIKMVTRPVIEYFDKKKLERDEVRESLREEGREEERTAWLAWNRRREEAKARSEDFNEPLPSESTSRE